MEFIEAIILGIVQGATEFIPVSSSGHLVIVPWLLGWTQDAEHTLLFDTVLHWGTLLAIFIVFWRDFWNIATQTIQSLFSRSMKDPYARLGWFIIVGSIPAAVAGLLFKDFFESLFASPRAAGSFLLVTSGLLFLSERLSSRNAQFRNIDALTWRDAILIGLAQSIALAPGISRSGSTIAMGLSLGIRRDEAARYSFLLGTPAFLGAGLLQLNDALSVDPSSVIEAIPTMMVGFIASAVTGYIAIRFLLAYLRTQPLTLFAIYCLVAGLSVIGLSFVW
ncbi:MAG: undecaprenyl-diphosphatase UppP [Chloroflexota bacterium]